MKPMLDIIYDINKKVSNNNRFLETIKFNSCVRLLMRQLANTIVPMRYLNSSANPSTENIPVVVSLTSFPTRIGKVWVVIESILRQTKRPERIILWLSKSQFPGQLNDLPKKLVSQIENGLEIRFVDGDVKSHKKYYYAFIEFPNKYILTIDDDLLFPSYFLDGLYKSALDNPNSVIASFGSKIKWDFSKNYFYKIYQRIEPGSSGKDLFFGSGGGTLFPPNKLYRYLDDINTIMDLCPTADDIYLNAIVRLAGLDVTFKEVLPLLSIENKNDKKLTDHNGNLYDSDSKNANQLRALINYTLTLYGKNPFISN